LWVRTTRRPQSSPSPRLLRGSRSSPRERNASTTQLLSIVTGDWDAELMAELGIRRDLFPALRHPGDPVGDLLPEVLRETGLDGPVHLTTVGSHDTASAVVAVPAASPRFAFIASGTWSLVGLQL